MPPKTPDETLDTLSDLMSRGRYSEAAHLCRSMIRRAPKDAFLHNAMGVALAQDDRADEAIRAFRRATELDPAYDEALGNLVSTLVQLGRVSEAVPYLRRAVQRDPSAPDLHRMLAAGLHVCGDMPGALQSADRALALQPGNLAAMNTRGATLRELGRLEEAQAQYTAILEQEPDQPDALLALGELQAMRGDGAAALATTRRVLGLRPEMDQAYQTIAMLHRFVPGDPMIDAMQARFDDPDATDQTRLYLGFALAKARADTGARDAVFARLAVGNAKKRALLAPWTPARRRKQVQRIKSLFSGAGSERLRLAASDSEVPIFVVGMPRSGTTLVEQVLSAHSGVHGAGELPDIERFGLSLLDAGRLPDRDRLAGFARGYIDRISALAPGATHVIDKMPSNADYVGLIRGLFPNARIIATRRDPRDTGWSIYRTLFGADGLSWAYDLADIAHYAAHHEGLMRHWTEQFPGAIHEVRYEELVTDPEPVIRALAAFCGLSWEDAMLAPEQVARAVATASMAQVRAPIHRDSMGGWRDHAEDLAPMIDVMRRAGLFTE